MSSILNDTFAILFSDFLYKNISCGNSFEFPRHTKTFVVGTRFNELPRLFC